VGYGRIIHQEQLQFGFFHRPIIIRSKFDLAYVNVLHYMIMVKLTPKYYLAAGLLGLNVAAISLPFTATADTQSTNTDIGLTVDSVITAYSSGPTVTLGAITPNGTGKQSAASDTVSATTNDAAGYTVTLKEANGTTTAMTSGANSIPAGSGTPGSPATLANNTWGWRIDSLSGFGAGPTSSISNAAPSALTYAAIPANGSPFTIQTTGAAGSNSKTVWYSARVDNTLPTGTYAATVTYTITTN
jgi:hypothetical protein